MQIKKKNELWENFGFTQVYTLKLTATIYIVAEILLKVLTMIEPKYGSFDINETITHSP